MTIKEGNRKMTNEQLRDDLEKAEAHLHELATTKMIRLADEIRTLRIDLVGALERGDLTPQFLETSLNRTRRAGAEWERLSELQDQLHAPTRETATQRLVDQVNDAKASQRAARKMMSDEEFSTHFAKLIKTDPQDAVACATKYRGRLVKLRDSLKDNVTDDAVAELNRRLDLTPEQAARAREWMAEREEIIITIIERPVD